MQKKNILTDTFTFENIIEKGGLYVDKTKYFHRLVSGAGSCYFCSRPRRFGKSLAISDANVLRKKHFGKFYSYGVHLWDAVLNPFAE